MKKISGPALCGFSDIFDGGTTIVGDGTSQQANAKWAKKSKAPAWKRTPIDKKKAAKLHPLHLIGTRVLENNVVVGGPLTAAVAKVKAVAKKAQASLKQKPHPAKAPAAARAHHAVHGLAVLLGVAAAATKKTGKKLTPKQTAAISKAVSAKKKADDAGKKLHTAATKAVAAGKGAVQAIKDIKSATGKKAGVHGYIGTDQFGLLPGDTGYDPSTDPDDTTGAYAAAQAPGEDPGLNDPSLNDPAIMTPEVPVVPAVPIEAVWNQPVPADGIVYDGTEGFPAYSVGSASYFYGPNRQNTDRPSDGSQSGMFGWIWGWNHANMNDLSSPRWVIRFGQDWNGNDNWHDQQGVPASDPSQLQIPPDAWGSGSAKPGMPSFGNSGSGMGDPSISASKYPDGTLVSAPGPFIGSPFGPLKNLRWSTVDKKWFWFLEEAPAKYTAALQYTVQKAAKAAADAEAAANAAAAAQAQKDAADQAAAQAAQDAQNALAESAADSAAYVSQTQAQTSQDSAAALTTQADSTAYAAQQQADAAAYAAQQQADTSTYAAQAALQAQQMQAQAQMLQQQPQLVYEQPQLMAPAGDDGQEIVYEDDGDAGGGGGGGDDTPDPNYDPGADVAQEPDYDVLGTDGVFGLDELDDTAIEYLRNGR